MEAADDDSSEQDTRRRRRRIPADEIRIAMFGAARELVYQQGVQISLEELSFEHVISLAGVSRSSAYRIWPYKGDFVQDLLCDLAGPNWLGTAALDRETIDLAWRIVDENASELDTAEGRRRVLLEAVKRCVMQNFTALRESNEWHIYVALNATAKSARNEESRLRVVAAQQHSEMTFIDRMTEFYTEILAELGLQMRHSAYTIRHLAMAGAAIVEGLALRQLIADTVEKAKRPPLVPDHGWSFSGVLSAPLPAPMGSRDLDWSLAAIGFLGILNIMTEPVPERGTDHPTPRRDQDQDTLADQDVPIEEPAGRSS